jgi:hypothetical protein
MGTKVVTYWRCDCENMERNLESLRNGDIVLNAT